MNAVTERPYSGVNVLLFWLSAECGYSCPRYLTFNQAKEAGGNVRKGEHGTKVYFFKQLTVADKASGENKMIPMLREYTVFNVAQCENLPNQVMNGEHVAPLNHEQRKSSPIGSLHRRELTFARVLAFPATSRQKISSQCRPSINSRRGMISIRPLSTN